MTSELFSTSLPICLTIIFSMLIGHCTDTKEGLLGMIIISIVFTIISVYGSLLLSP